MCLTPTQIAVSVIGVLHFVFMLGELIPWGNPKIMKLVLKKWPKELDLSDNDRNFAAMIVHNAGIYNGIIGAGLFASAFSGSDTFVIQVVLLSGGIVAGLFGAKTLSRMTVLQAVVGAIALGFVISGRK